MCVCQGVESGDGESPGYLCCLSVLTFADVVIFENYFTAIQFKILISCLAQVSFLLLCMCVTDTDSASDLYHNQQGHTKLPLVC